MDGLFIVVKARTGNAFRPHGFKHPLGSQPTLPLCGLGHVLLGVRTDQLKSSSLKGQAAGTVVGISRVGFRQRRLTMTERCQEPGQVRKSG